MHLRIPFSYYLLPVYLFSLSFAPNFTESSLLWSFLLIHVFLYPASNGYNSYFDKDEQSIGGLRIPPKVTLDLYYVAIGFDIIAIVLAYVNVSLTFSVMLLIYGLVSKAYSHPTIRLKKFPITGWLVAGLFQGLFTFLMSYLAVNRFEFALALRWEILIPGFLTTLMLWASYPMTQVYQHSEDLKRGDNTLSIKLGIRGTFLFSGLVFGLVSGCFWIFFNYTFGLSFANGFILAMAPVVLYFGWWFLKVLKNESAADFKNTMRLNLVSATSLNAYFIYLFLKSTNLYQYFGL